MVALLRARPVGPTPAGPMPTRTRPRAGPLGELFTGGRDANLQLFRSGPGLRRNELSSERSSNFSATQKSSGRSETQLSWPSSGS